MSRWRSAARLALLLGAAPGAGCDSGGFLVDCGAVQKAVFTSGIACQNGDKLACSSYNADVALLKEARDGGNCK